MDGDREGPGPALIPVDDVSIERFISASKDIFLQLQHLALMAEGLAKGPGKVSALCELVVALRDMKEMLDAPVKTLGALENSLVYSRLPELFSNDDIKTQTTAGGVRVVLTSRVQASAVDSEKMMEWLRSVGLEALIKPTVNASSLAAAVKEQMTTKGVEPPEDAIKVRVTPFVSLTKTKKAAS